MVQIRKPKVQHNVYRHFAAITVAITLVIGVFANGEGRQALADEVAERQEHARLQRAQVAKFGKPQLVPRHARNNDAWGFQGYGDSFDNDYGKPMDGGDSGGSRPASWKGRVSPTAPVPASYAPYGISQADWNAMSEAQREAFLRKRTVAQPQVTAEEHQRQVDGLMAASAARAGEAGDDAE